MIGGVIIVNNLVKSYGQSVALNGISFTVEKGSVVGLIGPNGAGKSSILKILAGLISGTLGDVIVNGISVASDPIKAKKNTSFMAENNPLPDHMRVGEYLRFRAELKGVPARKIRANTEKIMRQCDLYYEARHRMIKTLSKGYRQRIGIADAMLGDSEVVILDEPTIGLDPHQIIGIRKIIDGTRGMRTILISSHILSELETVCDNFIIINRGNIVAAGTLAGLASDVREKDTFLANIRGSELKIREIFEANGTKISSLERLRADDEWSIRFSATEKNHRSLLAKIAAESGLFAEKICTIEPSLEEIFLRATRRYRDQNLENKL
ncbi:MAG: ABC transporter ATP-binding protein [Puniceicoccales bacterium]|jgi:ABC-2 type transport system ATP-binding protein|nr:ABC transporter ATP-binding protein [Puniceicoccales bacterium]